MNEELVQKAMQMFDTSEKWSAFIELMNKNGEIQNRWWQKLQKEVYQREQTDGMTDWNIAIWNSWDIMWYIKGESNKTIAIHFNGDMFRICYSFGDLDTEKVNELLKNYRFDIIKTCFDRIDGTAWDTIGYESRNFSFGTLYDTHFPDHRILCWYAGNDTEKFADQLIAKVRKFQTPEITALFKEINEQCRK